MADLVSTIDIGAARADADIAADLDRACRTVGFFEVVGHGVPEDVVARMRRAADAFFALPLAEKLQCAPPDKSINRGYSARSTEGWCAMWNSISAEYNDE